MMTYLDLSTLLQPGGDPHVLCFVDFDSPAQATIALEALQGENTCVCRFGLCSCIDNHTFISDNIQYCMFSFLVYIFMHSPLISSHACFEIGKHDQLSVVLSLCNIYCIGRLCFRDSDQLTLAGINSEKLTFRCAAIMLGYLFRP